MEILHCWQVKCNLFLLKAVFFYCDILLVIYPLMGIAWSYDWYLSLDIIVWNKGKQTLEVMNMRHLERTIEISFVLTSSLLFLGNHIP